MIQWKLKCLTVLETKHFIQDTSLKEFAQQFRRPVNVVDKNHSLQTRIEYFQIQMWQTLLVGVNSFTTSTNKSRSSSFVASCKDETEASYHRVEKEKWHFCQKMGRHPHGQNHINTDKVLVFSCQHRVNSLTPNYTTTYVAL